MTWAIGTCQRCRYNRPDQYGGTCYCIFKRREHYFSIWHWRIKRRWIWLCDECESQTAQQRTRNKPPIAQERET